MTKISKATLTKAIISAQLAGMELKSKLKRALVSNEGDVFGQHGLTVAICVAIAGLALAFLIPYFRDTVGGGLETKTNEFFNMK